MKKFRTYKNYTLVYNLEKENGNYAISIEKSGAGCSEISTYAVHGTECELKSLLCRLWRCGVTPMSLVYILEDEGYLPKVLDVRTIKNSPMIHIARRERKESVINQNKMFVFDNSCYGTLCCEKESEEV